MMRSKEYPSIDGFVPRRPGGRDLISKKEVSGQNKIEDKKIRSRKLHAATDNNNEEHVILGDPKNIKPLRNKVSDNNEPTSDIGATLQEIEANEPQKDSKKMSRKERKLLKKQQKQQKQQREQFGAPRKKKSKIKRFFFWLFILFVLAIIGGGGYLVYKLSNVGGSVFQGNILDIFKSTPLKEDENGRSNFLLLGTSEDDKGHDGAYLTDSMMILSIDQTNHNAYMFSIPRDLYVNYGQACFEGYYGKINSYFMCANSGDSKEDEQDRLLKEQEFVGDIFGMDIQYGIHVNHTVIREAVDAVGGVDVDIQGSNGAPGILDRNFDWRCNYTCYYVKYDNGVHHLDGVHALFLSQARGDVAPTYGLANSNFDREINQQKIIMALKDKATETGTLTNFGAITGLIDALGNNLRTNISIDEIRTLMDIASNTKSDDIFLLSLFDEGLVMTGNYGGLSVVIPSSGMGEYGNIRKFVDRSITSDPVVRENADVAVLNGAGVAGLAQKTSDQLIDKNYNVVLIDNVPAGEYASTEVYRLSEEASYTANKIAEIYGVEVKTTELPFTLSRAVDIVVIVGKTEAE